VTGYRRSVEAKAWLIGLVTLVLVVSGCWPFPARVEALRASARSMVPPTSTIVAQDEGDCVELAPSPSCVHVYFVSGRAPLPARVRAVEETAGAGGWAPGAREFLPGGANLRFERGGFAAVVYLWGEERAGPCRQRPRKECADVVMVERR